MRILRKLIWWVFIRPPLLLLLLSLFIIYVVVKAVMTKILHIWYPNQEFI